MYGMTLFEWEQRHINSQFNPIVQAVGCHRCGVHDGQTCITKNGNKPGGLHVGRQHTFIKYQRAIMADAHLGTY